MQSSPGTPWFWGIIGSADRQLNRLARQLELMSREEILEFVFEYEEAMDAINPFASEAEELSIDLSEDSAEDFASWVVSLGDAAYDLLCNSPERTDEYLELFDEAERGEGLNRWDCAVDREEYRGWQSPTGLPVIIYESRFSLSFAEDLAQYRKRRTHTAK